MTVNNKAKLELAQAQLENAELLVKQARSHIEQFEAQQKAQTYPPAPSYPVICFETNYKERGPSTGYSKTYHWAARRIGGLWYLTGSQTKGFTWEQLVDWLRENMSRVSPIRQQTPRPEQFDIDLDI